MKKVYLTAAIVAAISTSFVACTNEMDEGLNAPVSSVAEGQSGKVLFSINTGKNVVYTRAAMADEAIKKISVLLFDARGNLLPGVKRDYTDTDLVGGNQLGVTIPSDQMNKTGLKAYLLANVDPAILEGVNTEAQVSELVATTLPTQITEAGIPMASGAIAINTNNVTIQAPALMKRAMSVLYVQVKSGIALDETREVQAGDFTYTVKKVRLDQGYLTKDGVVEGTETPEATWTPANTSSNNAELLGYMYQSEGFEIEITPNNAKLGTASRTVVVATDKASKRNKKYLLNVTPLVGTEGKVDFTVTVEAWDAEGGEFEVDWTERFTVSSSLPEGITYSQENGFEVNNMYKVMELADNTGINYGPMTNLLEVSSGVQLNATLKDLIVDEVGLKIEGGELKTTSWDVPLLNDTQGSLVFSTEKAGVFTNHEIPFTVTGCLVRPNPKFNFSWASAKYPNTWWKTFAGRIEIRNLQVLQDNTADQPLDKVFQLADGYKIVAISANETFTQSTSELYDADLTTRIGVQYDVALLGLSTPQIRFTMRKSIPSGYARFYVKIEKIDSGERIVRAMIVRFRN